VIPQIDAEIAEKGHFWMETKSYLDKTLLKGHGGHVLYISLKDLHSNNQMNMEEHD